MSDDADGPAGPSSTRSGPSLRSRSSGASGVIPCAAGTGTLGIREAMIEAVGRPVFERALGRLSSDERAQYLAVEPESWVPLDLSGRVIDTVAIEARRDVASFFEQVVRAGSVRSLNAFYRALLGFAWDEMLVARAASTYAKIRNVGRLEATLTSPGEAIAVLREWPDLRERAARSLGYTMEAFFLAAGKSDVTVQVELHPPSAPGGTSSGATYRCRWR